MAEFLWERFNITPHQSTISRALTAARLSRKQVRSVAAERNEELRLDWKRRIAEYAPEQLVFLDESACSEKASRCRTGWSLFGIAPQVQQRLHCRERFSILPAYTLEGYIAYKVIPGSFNSERFLRFVAEDVLPLLTPGYHVICLDNVNTHRSTVSFLLFTGFANFYRPFRTSAPSPTSGLSICRLTHLILTRLRRALRP